jgi:truncated hemoglobin YjbI
VLRAAEVAKEAKQAPEVQKAPLLQRLGGPDAVKAAVDIFYVKVRTACAARR